MEDIKQLPGYIRVEIWGDRALFTRPEFKIERQSFDCPTPSALRGILQAIYWHPYLDYEVRRITVLNPIRFDAMTCNELDFKLSSSQVKKAMDAAEKGVPVLPLVVPRCATRQQRLSRFLVDVHYVVEAVIVPAVQNKTREPFDLEKALQIFKRRVSKGACYYTPYLGIREFTANFAWKRYKNKPCVSVYDGTVVDLGIMFYDYDYTDCTKDKGPRPYFFHPRMVDGVIDVPRREEVIGYVAGSIG